MSAKAIAFWVRVEVTCPKCGAGSNYFDFSPPDDPHGPPLIGGEEQIESCWACGTRIAVAVGEVAVRVMPVSEGSES